MCISVDLPDPDGPTIPVSSPLGKSIETSSQRVDGGLPLAEAATQVVAGDDRLGFDRRGHGATLTSRVGVVTGCDRACNRCAG